LEYLLSHPIRAVELSDDRLGGVLEHYLLDSLLLKSAGGFY
jgi:hypothetical protein